MIIFNSLELYLRIFSSTQFSPFFISKHPKTSSLYPNLTSNLNLFLSPLPLNNFSGHCSPPVCVSVFSWEFSSNYTYHEHWSHVTWHDVIITANKPDGPLPSPIILWWLIYLCLEECCITTGWHIGSPGPVGGFLMSCGSLFCDGALVILLQVFLVMLLLKEPLSIHMLSNVQIVHIPQLFEND